MSQPDVVRLLLENGANPNIRGEEMAFGKALFYALGTPLFYAVGLEETDIVQALLEYGGDPNIKVQVKSGYVSIQSKKN